jgi:dCMP deaminase
MKRNDYITWDEYFMGISKLSAQRSKDPNTQVGACIVSDKNKILSVGYNGMPTGCSDDDISWDRDGEYLETKYPFVCHAELNAILNCAGGTLDNSRIYVSLFPCNECAKAIIQCGIKEVVYAEDKYPDSDSVIASKKMFSLAGVKIRQYTPTERIVKIVL